MKLLIFTEGTVIMHLNGKDVSREERVRQSSKAGIQGEARRLAYKMKLPLPVIPTGEVYDLENYIPIGNAVEKVNTWYKQGVEIHYLSSRRVEREVNIIKVILEKYGFPTPQNFHYRKQNQEYKDVAEELLPDILIEDDCESIGGVNQMTYTHIDKNVKPKIKSVSVKEFGGIDHLPDNIKEL